MATKDGTGSGVVIDSEGLAITNAHVVGHAKQVDVTFMDGTLVPAWVEASDPGRDLALLRLSGARPPSAIFADVDILRPGEPLLAIGYALNISGAPTITRGVFSALRTGSAVDYVQTDAPINPGNSGGPLISLRGEVVGINTLRLEQSGTNQVVGINFAISSVSVRRFIEMTAQPSATPPTTASAPPSTGNQADPIQTVRAYYEHVNQRDYAGAYGLMGAEITKDTDIDAFRKWFRNKQTIDLRDTQLERGGVTDAVVAARVNSTDHIGEADQIADYTDRWTLALENGGWRMESVSTTLANGLSTALAGELRSAVLAYDHSEERAYTADDPELVRPWATSNIVGQLKRAFDRNRTNGDHEVEKLESIMFRGFRQPSDTRAEVDAVEVWSSIHYDRQGGVTNREPASPLYMTMHFIHVGAAWLLDNTQFYKDNPF